MLKEIKRSHIMTNVSNHICRTPFIQNADKNELNDHK